MRTRERHVHLPYLDTNKSLLLACGAKLEDDSSNTGGGLYVVDLDTREAFIPLGPGARCFSAEP